MTARAGVEARVQMVIMLAIGGAAGAASFTHVHAVAAAHGQGRWLAWADAVVLELMSIASGLELRRRRRQGRSVVFPSVVLSCAVALSLAAQVVQAEASVIGWIAAALPALGFLVMVKIALGHSEVGAGLGTVPDGPVGPCVPRGQRYVRVTEILHVGHDRRVTDLTTLTGLWWDWEVSRWDPAALTLVADNDLTYHWSVEVSFVGVASVAIADSFLPSCLSPADRCRTRLRPADRRRRGPHRLRLGRRNRQRCRSDAGRRTTRRGH